MSRMNHVTVGDGFLHAEGGVNNGNLYAALAPYGNAFPGGTCPSVGVSGYSMGGGWGLSCRLLGLGCDSLESVELVDAWGRLLTANAHCNQELYSGTFPSPRNRNVHSALLSRRR
jgi:FAD/FMN-containing dehydrogenase